MKVVICGSRNITDYALIVEAIRESGFEITEVVSGCARGVDLLGERWAKENGIPIAQMPAEWEKHGKVAGFIRNREMVEYVGQDGGVIAVWDGVSKGTTHTINLAKEKKVKLYVKKA
jgi:hypothetical protein